MAANLHSMEVKLPLISIKAYNIASTVTHRDILRRGNMAPVSFSHLRASWYAQKEFRKVMRCDDPLEKIMATYNFLKLSHINNAKRTTFMHKDSIIINNGSKWKNRKNIKKPWLLAIKIFLVSSTWEILFTKFIPNEQRITNSIVSFHATMTIAIKGQVKFLPHRLWSTRYTFMHL